MNYVTGGDFLIYFVEPGGGGGWPDLTGLLGAEGE